LEQTTEERPLELKDYIAIVRRRKWYIVLPVTAIVVATIIASVLTTPVYQASTDVMVSVNPQLTVADIQVPAVDTQRELQTQIQVILSRAVAEETAKRLGIVGGAEAIQPRIQAQTVGQTNIIRISAKHPSAAMARDIANNVAATYIDLRRKAALDNYARQAAEIQQKLDEATAELKKAEDELNAAIARTRGEKTVDAGEQAAVAALASRRDRAATVQSFWKTALDKLQIQSGLQTSSAEIVSPAVLPQSPVEPRLGRQMAFALAISLIIGTAVAFVVDYLDDSIRSKDEAARAFGAPVIGMIPRDQTWTDRSEALLVSLKDPASTIAEAYRSVRTNLQFALLDSATRIVVITSPGKGEGKSSLTANLAVVLAQAGKSVIVIDADLRRPRIHRFFHLPNNQGLTTAILAERPLADLLQRPRLAGCPPNLLVLTSGPIPPNPADLLGSQRMADIIESLAKLADFVLIDTPPVLALSDAAILAPKANGLIMVARAPRSKRRTARFSKERIDTAGGTVLGIVLNDVTPAFAEAGYYYYYNYYYYLYRPYGQEKTSRTKRPSLLDRMRRKEAAEARRAADSRVQAGV
jgi:succinoglycan biosynthesis transport protein ExoP